MNTNSKIVSLDEFERIRKDLVGTVVLSHGVFDVVHSAHVDYFQKSKDIGDCLVVSLTDDQYVNKGPGRPYFDIDQRLSVIAGLDVVDYVIVSPEPSSVTVINIVKPHIYTKGVEYCNQKDITGKIDIENEAVRLYGGKTVYIKTEEILSSSKIVNGQLFTPEFKQFISLLKTKYDIQQIYNAIDRLKNLNLAIVGETIIDEYILGEAIGKSSKYPSIVFNKKQINIYDGGAIAVAKQLSSFINSIKIITCIGDDDYYPYNLPPNVDFLAIHKVGTPTIKKTRFIDSYYKSRLFETYDIDNRPLNQEEGGELHSLLSQSDDCLKIGIDYGHGFLTGHENLFCVNSQSNAGNKGYNYISKFKNVQHMVLDEEEMRLENRDTISDIVSLTEAFFKDISVQSVPTTMGSRGCAIVNNDKVIRIPAVKGDVVDTVGAGDAFFGMYSCVLSLEGCDPLLAGFLANVVGYMTANTLGHSTNYDILSLKQTINTLLK